RTPHDDSPGEGRKGGFEAGGAKVKAPPPSSTSLWSASIDRLECALDEAVVVGCSEIDVGLGDLGIEAGDGAEHVPWRILRMEPVRRVALEVALQRAAVDRGIGL